MNSNCCFEVPESLIRFLTYSFSVRVIFWLFVYTLFLTIDLVPQAVEDFFVAKIFYSKLFFNLAFCWPCGMIPDIAYIWSQCAHNTYAMNYTEWFWINQQIVGPLLCYSKFQADWPAIFRQSKLPCVLFIYMVAICTQYTYCVLCIYGRRPLLS